MELTRRIWRRCRVCAGRGRGRPGRTKGGGPGDHAQPVADRAVPAILPRRDLRERRIRAWVARGENGGRPTTGRLRRRSWRCGPSGRLAGLCRLCRLQAGNRDGARTPDAVRDLLMRVWEPARAKALADAAVLEAMMQADGINGAAGAVGLAVTMRTRRKAEHDLDEAALKPYLSLEAMMGAMFDCANRLFGLEFREIEVPLYHPDVRAWEVTRAASMWRCSSAITSPGGQTVGRVVFGDAQPAQAGRRAAAHRRQRLQLRQGRPCLLSYDDARTLFHEFGHALHQMLSDVTYGFMAAPVSRAISWNCPASFMNTGLSVPEVLDRHARTCRPASRCRRHAGAASGRRDL
jgi:peptidyl-dipeptidase Dcp